MKRYATLSLGEVITTLRTLPNDPLIQGLDGALHSYRGYYERAASDPVEWPTRASVLADSLTSQIGDPLYGWKGGEYRVSASLPLHIANQGDTGPSVAGFEPSDVEGVYQPVVIEESWF